MVLDPRQLGGTSTEENADCQILDMLPARERARVLFPRSCASRLREGYNRVFDMRLDQAGLSVTIHGLHQPEKQAVYYSLDRTLTLRRFEYGDGLRGFHARLRAAGQLDPDLTDAEVREMWKIRVLKQFTAAGR